MILDKDDLERLVSRLRSSMAKLDTSGDYPEKNFDTKLLRKLTDMLYDLWKKEQSEGKH